MEKWQYFTASALKYLLGNSGRTPSFVTKRLYGRPPKEMPKYLPDHLSRTFASKNSMTFGPLEN
jgi:hypothetical protein